MARLGLLPCPSVVLGAIVLSISAFAYPSVAQMRAPNVGAIYTFDCKLNDRLSRQERYTIASVNGDVMRVDVDAGSGRNWYEKPYHLSGTTLVLRESIKGRSSSTTRSTNGGSRNGRSRPTRARVA